MSLHSKQKSEVLSILSVDELTGLTPNEVKERQAKYGENKLKEKKAFLEKEYKIEVLILSTDLSVDNSYENIIKFVDEKNIVVDKCTYNTDQCDTNVTNS